MDSSKAVFLDRDGVLLRDAHLITSQSQVEILPRVREALLLLKSLHYKLVLVSNQTVVARGLMSHEEMVRLNQSILDSIGVPFDAVCLCPHHPKATIPEFRQDCQCRKPKPGMILEASRNLRIDPKTSFMIGDRLSDIYSGKSAGCRSFQLLTGAQNEPLIETTLDLNPEWMNPDARFSSLFEAATYIRGLQ